MANLKMRNKTIAKTNVKKQKYRNSKEDIKIQKQKD